MKIQSLITSTLLVAISLVTTGCGPQKIDGNYSGLLRNDSYGIEADVFISLSERDGFVSGTMTIGAPLNGGGSFRGKRDGNFVQFTTNDGAIGQITWIGEVDRRTLGGTYVANPGDIMTIFGGAQKQQGRWFVER